MKKIYIEPRVRAVEIKLHGMICTSLGAKTDKTAGEDGWSEPQSMDLEMEDF